MANGRLATLDITSASTDTQLYSPTAGKTGSFSVCMVNRTSSTVTVRIALTNSTSISADEYIAYEHQIYPYEEYERSGLVLIGGQYVYVRSSATGVNAVVYGYEE
jgi:hypothetical protein